MMIVQEEKKIRAVSKLAFVGNLAFMVFNVYRFISVSRSLSSKAGVISIFVLFVFAVFPNHCCIPRYLASPHAQYSFKYPRGS
jgi:hypothetical protein